MTGTTGLSYTLTGFPAWLTTTNGTASTSGGTTTGSSQTLTYETNSTNPNATARTATVTLKAGYMTKQVAIKQAASTFAIKNPTGKIAQTANSNVTGQVTATSGLKWTISPTSNNGITVSPTSGNGSVQITFTGSGNTGEKRTGSFTVSATGANPARKLTISAIQAGKPGPYVGDIQVCRTGEGEMQWSAASKACQNSTKEGKSDWRLPTYNELRDITGGFTMQKLEQVDGFASHRDQALWSGDATSAGHWGYWPFGISSGMMGFVDSAVNNVRCVRNK